MILTFYCLFSSAVGTMLAMLNFIVSLLTIKTLLVGLLTGLIVKWIMKRLMYKPPPGPTPLPIIGNMLQFKTEMMHEQMFEWSKMFGLIISVYFGPSLVVVVNDIQSAMDVTVRKGSDFGGRVSTPLISIIGEEGSDIAFGDYGPWWKLQKKLSMKALRQCLLGHALEERVHLAIDLLSEELNNARTQINPNRYIDLMMGNILIGVCFGEAHKLMDPEVKRLIDIDDEFAHRLFDGSSLLQDQIPGLHYVWETSNMKWSKNLIKELKDLFMPKIRDHQNTINIDNVRDITDSLIIARTEAGADMQAENGNKFTDNQIFNILKNIFFAGIQTSRHTLQYAILHMVAYPDIQSKVQEEINRIVGPHDLPKLIHRADLGYTEAVLRESMRLASVIPTGLPHKTLCDTSVGGYDVPRNTMVVINHWALHHDPTVWENADHFIPERFLDTDGKLGPTPENWFPFSAGKRVCMGETVAKPELLLLFAALMQRFTWKIPTGRQVDLSPNGNMFSIYPKPHEMFVEKRSRDEIEFVKQE